MPGAYSGAINAVIFIIGKIATDKFTQKISDKFNVKVELVANMDDYNDIEFGKIPTPDDLVQYVSISNININILDTLTTTKEFNNYLISLTKYMLNDVNTVPLLDMEDGKIFDFKYDYKKLNSKNPNSKLDIEDGYVVIKDKSFVEIYAFNKSTKIPIEKFITTEDESTK